MIGKILNLLRKNVRKILKRMSDSAALASLIDKRITDARTKLHQKHPDIFLYRGL